jgi:hypothetical protein
MLVYHNLGLGDHIACNGMVRHFAESSGVVVICKTVNYRSVSAMYSDNPSISVLRVHDDATAHGLFDSWKGEKIAVGCYNKAWDPQSHTPFDVMFYEQAGIPHAYRWDKFKCPDRNRIPARTEPYIFIHEDTDRGYTIEENLRNAVSYKWDESKIVRPNRRGAIGDWIDVVGNAEEVHCINSAFLILADQVPTRGRLVWHKYARNEGDICNPTARKPWLILG